MSNQLNHCGVKYGNTHHVVCSKESCPVGELCVQILGCCHDEDTWYMKSPDSREYFPGLIKRFTMREHEDEGLGE